MIKLEDKTMTKKQYFIPQTETMPLFSTIALCVSGGGSEPTDAFNIYGGLPPEQAF